MTDEVGRQRAEEIVRQCLGRWPERLWALKLTDAITEAITTAVELERQRCVAEHAAINALTRAQQVEIAQLRDALAQVPTQRGR